MFEEIRFTLTNRLVSTNPPPDGIPIVVDNDPFDWNNPPPLFVYARIEFNNAEQVSMSVDPVDRVYGTVSLQFSTREGTGSAEITKLMQWGANTLRYPIILTPDPRITFQTFKPSGSQTLSGWYRAYARANFYADPP